MASLVERTKGKMMDNSGLPPTKRARLAHNHDILVEEVSTHQREIPENIQGYSAKVDCIDPHLENDVKATVKIRKAKKSATKKNEGRKFGSESAEVDIDLKQESNMEETRGLDKARKIDARKIDAMKKGMPEDKFGGVAVKITPTAECSKKQYSKKNLLTRTKKEMTESKIKSVSPLHPLLDSSSVAQYQHYNRLHTLVLDIVTALKDVIKNEKLLPIELSTPVEEVIEKKNEKIPQSELSTSVEESIKKKNEELFPSELSTEWCSAFQRYMPTLPPSQVHNIFSTLLRTLDADCVSPLEDNPKDTGSVKIILIVSQLLRIFLRGVHIADHTVHVPRVAQFSKLLANLHSLLGRLGSALLQKQYDHLLMTSFLGLCLAWGDMHVLLLNYRPLAELVQQPTLADPDTTPTNLFGLHSYLMNEQWSLIAQRITNFGEGSCRQLLDKLILQKLSAMILFDNEACKYARAAAAKSLAVSLEEDLLETVGDNGLMLTASLDSKQTLALAGRIVERIKGVNTWPESEFKKPGIQENRPLILGLLVQTLSGIRQNFISPKSSDSNSYSLLAKDVCAYFSPDRIKLTDMQSPSTNKIFTEIVTDMALCIEKCLAHDVTSTSLVTTKFDFDTLDNYLRILMILPLDNLNEELQTILLSCFLALIITVETVCSEDKHQETAIKKKLQDLLLRVLDGKNSPNICKHVKVGLFLRWLSQIKVQRKKTHCRQLLQILFSKTLLDISCLESLELGVPLLLKDGDKKPEASNPVHFEAALILLQAINKHKTSEPKMNFRCKKMQVRLGSYLMNITRNINKLGSDFECKHLLTESFQTILESYVATKDACLLNDIKGEIKNITVLVIKNVKEGDTCSLSVLALCLEDKVIREFLPEDFASAVWVAVMDLDNILELRVKLIRAMTYEQFKTATNNLLAKMKSSMTASITPAKVDNFCELWTSLVTARVGDGKTALRLKILTKLTDILLTATLLGHITDIKPILQFNVAAVDLRDARVSKVMLNFYLESITVLPLLDLQSIQLGLELLQGLLKNFPALVENVLPAFIQRYSHMLRLVANADSKDDQNSMLETCAFGLERLADMIADKLFVRRVAPFIIADILQQFETHTLRPDIKLHFINSMHSFFKICDDPNIWFLAGALTPASKLVFEAEYNKYASRRFTGKI